MKKIIEIKNIDKVFGKRKVLDNLNFDVIENRFIAIMGSSGSGKTTALNIASGLLKPTNGSVLIDGVDITTLKEPKLTKFRVAKIGYIFQDYSLIEYLNVLENIKYTSKMAKQKIDKQHLKNVIDKTGLSEHLKKLPSKLSGGQKQRVAIARSLVSNANVIFADEPTGALDISTRGNILGLLKDAKEEFRKTIVMVTHADEVIFIADGKFKNSLINASSIEISKKLIELESNNV